VKAVLFALMLSVAFTTATIAVPLHQVTCAEGETPVKLAQGPDWGCRKVPVLSCRSVTVQVTVPPGQFGLATASCQLPEFLAGGGCDWNSLTAVMTSSKPFIDFTSDPEEPSQDWECSGIAGSSPSGLQAIAVCCSTPE
jgi:hypothetical protein